MNKKSFEKSKSHAFKDFICNIKKINKFYCKNGYSNSD